MKNPTQIRQLKSTAKAFLQEDEIAKRILDVCAVKPVESWRKWRDDFGNFLNLSDNRTVTISRKDGPYAITDLYYKASPSDVLYHSDKILWWFDDNSRSVTWLLGKDERLRLFIFDGLAKKYQKYPPLSLSINAVRRAVGALDKNETDKQCFTVNIRPDDPADNYVEIKKCWITGWPIGSNIKTEMFFFSKTLAEEIRKYER